MTPEEQAAAEAKAAQEKAAAEQAAAEAAAAKAKAEADAKKTPEQLAAENEAAKFRRLHEKAQKDLDAAQAELKKRQDAELTESERIKKERDDLAAERDRLKLDNMRQKIAAEKGLDAELTEFLTGTDEETLRSQADKLASKVTAPTGTVTPPKAGGTSTQPARGAAPSIDEQIEAAYKAGNQLQAIRLKREKAFGAS